MGKSYIDSSGFDARAITTHIRTSVGSNSDCVGCKSSRIPRQETGFVLQKPGGIIPKGRQTRKVVYRPDTQQVNPGGRNEVGDLRLSWTIYGPQPISLLGQQQNGGFIVAWKSPRSGSTVERLSAGELSSAEMLGEAENENAVLTWVIRFVGFLVWCCAFSCIASPLAWLRISERYLTCFEPGIITAMTGFAACLLSAILSLLVISIAGYFTGRCGSRDGCSGCWCCFPTQEHGEKNIDNNNNKKIWKLLESGKRPFESKMFKFKLKFKN